MDTYRQPYGYKYAICLKNDNIPIGYVNIDINEPHDLGYGLLKAFWRNGIVTEAANAVIHQAKKDGIPYITATHDIKNPRSGNVMKRLGMLYQYSYEEQWQPKNILTTFCMYQLNFDGQDKRVYKGYLDQSPNQADWYLMNVYRACGAPHWMERTKVIFQNRSTYEKRTFDFSKVLGSFRWWAIGDLNTEPTD